MSWKPRVFIMLGILIFTVPFLSSESVFAQEKPGTKQEKLYTFDFSSANIVDIIRLLSKEYNVNIVAGEEIQGRVSGHFRQPSTILPSSKRSMVSLLKGG